MRSDGTPISAFTLRSCAGFEAVVLDQGAILQSLRLPSGRNVVLGFEDWAAYENDTAYIGRFIGPNANRIAEARFRIDAHCYHLTANDGANNLHSGPDGFDSQLWTAAETKNGLALKLKTAAGHNGFPGATHVSLNISLIKNKLRLDVQATSDRPTPFNPTWHPYWNLCDDTRVDGHDLHVDAQNHTHFDSGKSLAVEKTRHDFRRSTPLGSVRLDANYKAVKSAHLQFRQTRLTVSSSLPDMQVYTGDSLPHPRSGIALEPQFQPNDINLGQKCLLREGSTYHHWIEYCFDEI